jgi:hypothetical protein
VARMEEGRKLHKILVGKPEGKRALRRPWHIWENRIGITMDLEVTGWKFLGVGWIYPAQCSNRCRTLLNAVMKLRVLMPRNLLVTLTSTHSPKSN